ncbi:MAG: hypothetical protein KIT08_01460 [Anaerolineales bacterium]|nr:MAG: hypothetical protein KIT08_01460 [Anaerolineales bacterium]
MSSLRSDWETPSSLVADLAPYFPWDLDVCATRPNVCANYYSADALEMEWSGLCWMNPPYGRQIGKWVAKAANSKATTVCLVPARTDTRWWQENINAASLVVFIKGRLYFAIPGKETGPAPFPCAFVVFGELNQAQINKLSLYGWAVKQ